MAVVSLVLTACGSDRAESGTVPADDPAHGTGLHGGTRAGDGVYGSSMAPAIVPVAEIAELGPGPSVGDTWRGHLGLNVCGRFLEPPGPAGTPVGGFSADGTGAFTLAPTTEADAGRGATVADLAATVGIGLETGTLSLPPSTTPAAIDLDRGPLTLAGATLGTGQDCGGVRASVQLWVYTPEAAETGEDVRVVVTDPQDVPVVRDGMVFVIALAPTSSLPTLPPSALQR